MENVFIEKHINGGGTIVHVFLDEFVKMEVESQREFATKVIQEIFAEDKDGYAHHCLGTHIHVIISIISLYLFVFVL